VARPAGAVRLIDDVRGEAAPQENTLVALPVVRRALPGLAELTASVPQDKRILPRGDWDLILDIGMVAVDRLSVRCQRDRVEGAGVW